MPEGQIEGEYTMDTLKKFFPRAFKATDVKELIIAIVIYAIIDIVCGAVIGLAAGVLALIPFIGLILAWALGVVGSLVGVYALVGIVLSILVFLKVIK